MKLHVLAVAVATLLSTTAMLSAQTSVIKPVGFPIPSRPTNCGCIAPACTSGCCPKCDTPCAAKSCGCGGPECLSCGCEPVFGGPHCARLQPNSLREWTVYLGRGLDSLIPCGRSCGRPAYFASSCGCGTGFCGCGTLPPPGYCHKRNPFALWPELQCCPDGGCGCSGGGCCGKGLGCRKAGGGALAVCSTCKSCTSGKVSCTSPCTDGHTPAEVKGPTGLVLPTPPELPQKGIDRPAPKRDDAVDPPAPKPAPDNNDPFKDDNLPPAIERDVLNLAPPARMPSRTTSEGLKLNPPRQKTAQVTAVGKDIVPASHDEPEVNSVLVKFRPITPASSRRVTPREEAHRSPPPIDQPINPLR